MQFYTVIVCWRLMDGWIDEGLYSRLSVMPWICLVFGFSGICIESLLCQNKDSPTCC